MLYPLDLTIHSENSYEFRRLTPVNNPPVSYLSSCSLFPFSYSLNRLRQPFEIAETKWINHENDNNNDNDNDNDNDSENGNDKQRFSNYNGYIKIL